jgi:hypothetical protein
MKQEKLLTVSIGEESRTVERLFRHSSYVDTVNGISIYYDYGADYYYFVDDVN